MVQKLIISLLIIIGTSISGQAQFTNKLRTEIEKIIYYDTEIIQKKIPGYSIGLLYEDTAFVYHFGNISTDQTPPLNDSTIFELGGLSKVFTASLVEVLHQKGILDYNQPFNHFLDALDRNPHLQSLTLLDLITHYTSFPKLPYEFGVKEKEVNNPYAFYTKRDLLDFYKKYQPDQPYKKRYSYSHINYALIEIAIEKVMKNDFEQVLTQELFVPLGMQHSYIENGDSLNPLTPGHAINLNQVAGWDFQSFAASEGIKSNMLDLLNFTKTCLSLENEKLSKILEHTHQPLKKTTHNKLAKIAKGWHVLKNKRYYDVILHSGSTNGHRAYIGFVKETKTAVVVLSNSEISFDGVGQLVLRMLNNNWRKQK